MKFYDDFLYLKKSKIPGAGKGLFTNVDIPKGKIIVEYNGKIVLWKDVKHTDGYNAYLFKLNRTYAIDAEKKLNSLGRYANDARGFSKIKGFRNNSEYITKKNKCFIKSIRKIHKGEEILVPYGKAYWDLIHKIKLSEP